jgi:hypothetical protein
MSSEGEYTNGVPYTDDFDQVLRAEYAEIDERRKISATNAKARENSGGTVAAPLEVPEELFGLALSGGGIRSACFCLGALQALDQYRLIPRIDYLSTVSGGGYIGASMVAEMSRTAQPNKVAPFPFANGTDDIRDNALVGHIRDNSRFLAPKKTKDILVSIAIMLRGLAVNLLMVLVTVLPFSIALVLMNPTTAHLDHSIFLDFFDYLWPGASAVGYLAAARSVLADPFLLSKAAAIALGLFLVGWAIWRSYVELYRPDEASKVVEPARAGARISARLFILLILAFVVELQPIVVGWVIEFLKQPVVVGQQGLAYLGAVITAAAAATAAFRERLVAWIQRALSSPTVGARLRALFARSAFYAAALAVPLVIYGLFLILAVWGIKDVSPDASASPYRFAPTWLLSAEWSNALLIAVLLLWALYALAVGFHNRNRFSALAKAIYARWRLKAAAVLLLSIALLVCAALATRAVGGHTIAYGDAQWIVLLNYVLVLMYVGTITANFSENANSLHRLYRDRLSAAFRLGSSDDGKPLRLNELHQATPYILINGTLNVRQAADEPTTGLPKPVKSSDPAKRGRNAEFFLFSRRFVGSDATGYVATDKISSIERQLDLATATAISGAAVSSSMGRLNIGLLGPTLALLNLRLGFWLTNPRFVAEWGTDATGVRRQQNLANREWSDILRFYLFAEAFGRMRSDSSRIYVTDGGHIDNLGLYQLLKRKCKLIIVIDAEADAGLNFAAFCDVQRFARIDQGIRIDALDWQPIREAALKRAADRSKTVPRDSEVHQRHFAVGKILYENDPQPGVLLYVKASVTGDEPDYVLDYERRYPLFPYESTGDQFFSEEQMEAYRALGFHATRVALEERKATPGGLPQGASLEAAAQPVGPGQEPLVTRLKDRLGIKGAELS